MKYSRYEQMQNRSNQLRDAQNVFQQRCDLCNVPILNDLCSDSRSIGVFNGKGEVLCKKCATFLSKIPAEQALQALNNASEMYPRW